MAINGGTQCNYMYSFADTHAHVLDSSDMFRWWQKVVVNIWLSMEYLVGGLEHSDINSG